MHLSLLTLSGFKSFGAKTVLSFPAKVTAVVGPNGSGKSNVAEAFAWVLGEQSMKSLRGKRGEDLIWNGSRTLARQSRASVTLTFDNSDRTLPFLFDEVTVGREVFRDGTNQYFINGSQVRLRDLHEALGGASLGGSRHHIISQGEADRVLSASPRERRELLEEALGLSVYHWKIEESEKKLLQTEENLREAKSVRRELSGHLRFMEREAEKIEKANRLREELGVLVRVYLANESKYLSFAMDDIAKKKNEPEMTLSEIKKALDSFHTIRRSDQETEELRSERERVSRDIFTTRDKRSEITRRIGRLEGMLDYATLQKKAEEEKEEHLAVRVRDLEPALLTLEKKLETLRSSTDLSSISKVLEEAWTGLRYLFGLVKEAKGGGEPTRDTAPLKEEREILEKELNQITLEEKKLTEKDQKLAEEIEQKGMRLREEEREQFRLKTEAGNLERHIALFDEELRNLDREKEEFERLEREITVLVGVTAIADYQKEGDLTLGQNRESQEIRRRDIERLTLRLEDLGLPSQEILAEYEAMKERDTFLAREIGDLETTSQSLRALIGELEEKISNLFREGLDKVNNVFNEFFSILFDGGDASLALFKESEKEGEETKDVLPGVLIKVNLPRKRVRSLDMLSGGERALTSIALLFAVSQVNPPPFLVLDETDAALDEANSKKYGDMLERLSKSSQLVVITHNRETMSRAQILYGVTMNSDGLSKILSVKFEEAVAIAK
jgi:chromosome segregation protein